MIWKEIFFSKMFIVTDFKNSIRIKHDFSNRGIRGQSFKQFKTIEPNSRYGLCDSVKFFTNWVHFSRESIYLSIRRIRDQWGIWVLAISRFSQNLNPHENFRIYSYSTCNLQMGCPYSATTANHVQRWGMKDVMQPIYCKCHPCLLDVHDAWNQPLTF